MQKIITSIAVIIIFAFTLTSCAKPTIVKVAQDNDYNLSCQELQSEISLAEQYKAKAREEDKFSLKNVGAGVVVIPALVSIQNMHQAEKNAYERIQRLQNISTQKECNIKKD